MVFSCSNWIWLEGEMLPDSYGEFYKKFLWENGKTLCRISCDGDYVLYINGKVASFWQYGAYEHYKVYDEVDITPYLQAGENHLAVQVWHYGADSQRYIVARAGLLYEIVQEKVLAFSDESTLCRLSPTFANGKQKIITNQLGFSFSYDANFEDDWKMGKTSEFENAVVVEKRCQMVVRPIAKNILKQPAKSTCLIAENDYYLFDLGQETVGVPMLSFVSDCAQQVLVQWGEDLQDGHVRRIIKQRDFSFSYRAKPGENTFVGYMLRMGCRYIEVFTEHSIDVEYIGIRPTPYPTEKVDVKLDNPLDVQIYNTCVKTLQLCMMDRYVDTPWREQGLYVFDARNQMLCGYYAFKNGNAEFARAALKLISEDRREDELLSITYPCGIDLTIPSFSLHYFKAVREYSVHTGDWSLAINVYPKMKTILNAFIFQMKDDLICRFEGKNHWNFYDWSNGLDGNIFQSDEPIPDLIINCLFIIACQEFSFISNHIGKDTANIDKLIKSAQQASKKTFFNPEFSLFAMTENGSDFSVLGNALAILAGLLEKKQARDICHRFNTDEMVECSLSMKIFQYDAMLKADKCFKQEILTEIREIYGKMLSQGATSVWETAEGATAFENSGSLCHGWSAIPIYYYHKLLDNLN